MSNDNRNIVIGLAVAAGLAVVAFAGRAGAQARGPLAGAADAVEQALDPASGIPALPSASDVAGALDSFAGGADEAVGQIGQSIGDTIEDVSPAYADALPTVDTGTVVDFVTATNPTAGVAEGAVEAGGDLVDEVQSGGTSGSTGGDSTTSPDLSPDSGGWEDVDVPEPEPDSISAPEPDDSGSYNEYDDPSTDSIETNLPGLTLDPDDI